MPVRDAIFSFSIKPTLYKIKALMKFLTLTSIFFQTSRSISTLCLYLIFVISINLFTQGSQVARQ